MRFVSWSAVASFGCLLLAGLVYVAGRLEAARMEDAGQGLEMAFYFSPLVFLTVDTLLTIGALVGFGGAIFTSGWRYRMQACISAGLSVSAVLLVPWRA